MLREILFRNLKLTASLGILVLCLLSCAPVQPAVTETQEPTEDEAPVGAEPDSGSEPGLLLSQVARDLSPDTSDQDLGDLVAGNNAFAWDFYHAVREQDGNMFYSPYSISTALAMTYAGARADTEKQMAQTLHYDLPQDRLHPAFNGLDLKLNSPGEDASADDESQPFQLNIANSLWGQSGYSFLPEFLDLLALNYGAGLRLVDFIDDVEGARLQINEWVAENTGGRIKDLIPQGAIDELTRLVLANAIYFKADWSDPFEKEQTRDGPFTLLDDSQVDVPMMAHDAPSHIPYMAGDGYQAVELPYIGETTSMVVMVPDAGKFEEFEAALDRELVETILHSLESLSVNLIMPKFSFESEYGLRDALAAMGMADAFDPRDADFSGMDGKKELYISDVFHKAFVAVDEKGTEAAAATAVIMRAESMPMVDIELTVDRPFIFLIQDKPSGAILFIGRIVNPQT